MSLERCLHASVMEKEGEGKEKFFCRKTKWNGLLVKQEARPHSRRKGVGRGFGDRKEARLLDQSLQGFSEGITNTGPLLEF